MFTIIRRLGLRLCRRVHASSTTSSSISSWWRLNAHLFLLNKYALLFRNSKKHFSFFCNLYKDSSRWLITHWHTDDTYIMSVTSKSWSRIQFNLFFYSYIFIWNPTKQKKHNVRRSSQSFNLGGILVMLSSSFILAFLNISNPVVAFSGFKHWTRKALYHKIDLCTQPCYSEIIPGLYQSTVSFSLCPTVCSSNGECKFMISIVM